MDNQVANSFDTLNYKWWEQASGIWACFGVGKWISGKGPLMKCIKTSLNLWLWTVMHGLASGASFSWLYKLTNSLIFKAKETAMTDNFDLFHSTGHRVSPYKICPGGNSVLLFVGIHAGKIWCVVSCTKFQLRWEEFGTLCFCNFEVKYLSWVLTTSTHAFSFGFTKTVCKPFSWEGKRYTCDTRCLTRP